MFTVKTEKFSSKLVITNPEKEDMGTYECLVENAIGERANVSGYLIVYGKC
jgi:hypothetical protein